MTAEPCSKLSQNISVCGRKKAFLKSRGALLKFSIFLAIFDIAKNSHFSRGSLCYIGEPGPCRGHSGEEEKFEIERPSKGFSERFWCIFT